jgi:hypothetical protein
MKKVIRILGVCALVAFAFTSCNKEKEEVKSFSATTAQLETNSDSKTHIGGTSPRAYFVWDAGNVINVFNDQGQNVNFEVSKIKNNGKIAEFHITDNYSEFMENLTIPNSYTAFYPDAVCDHGEIAVPLPSRQNQAYINWEYNVANNTFPMFGHNNIDPQGNFYFTFASDACVMEVKFGKQNEHTSIDSLVFTSKVPGELIAGNLVYDLNGNYVRFDGTKESITIDAYRPQNWSSGTFLPFQIVFPAGIFATGFNLDVYEGGTMISHNEGYIMDNDNNRVVTQARTYVSLDRIILPNPVQPEP